MLKMESSQAHCEKCKARVVLESAKFCHHCGSPLQKQDVSGQAGGRLCLPEVPSSETEKQDCATLNKPGEVDKIEHDSQRVVPSQINPIKEKHNQLSSSAEKDEVANVIQKDDFNDVNQEGRQPSAVHFEGMGRLDASAGDREESVTVTKVQENPCMAEAQNQREGRGHSSAGNNVNVKKQSALQSTRMANMNSEDENNIETEKKKEYDTKFEAKKSNVENNVNKRKLVSHDDTYDMKKQLRDELIRESQKQMNGNLKGGFRQATPEPGKRKKVATRKEQTELELAVGDNISDVTHVDAPKDNQKYMGKRSCSNDENNSGEKLTLLNMLKGNENNAVAIDETDGKENYQDSDDTFLPSTKDQAISCSKTPIEHDEKENDSDDVSSTTSAGDKPVSSNTRGSKKKKTHISKSKRDYEKKQERKKRKIEDKKQAMLNSGGNEGDAPVGVLKQGIGKLRAKPEIEMEVDNNEVINNPLMGSSYADAAKGQETIATKSNERKSQKHSNSTKNVPDISRSAKSDDIEVHLYAIVNSSYCENLGFGVVFGDLLGNWQAVVPGKISESTLEGMSILSITIFAPKFNDKIFTCRYKYVMVKPGHEKCWEENQSYSGFRGQVNRRLVLTQNDTMKGVHNKFDDLVLFSDEHEQKQKKGFWNKVGSFLGFHSSQDPSTRLQPIEEFLLVLSCYMPNWNGFKCVKPKESEARSESAKSNTKALQAITRAVDVVRSLQSISFADDYIKWGRKYDFLTHEKLRIFNDLFRAKIFGNIACLRAGKSSIEIFQYLISGISMAHLLKTFIPAELSGVGMDSALPLISCISLRFSYLADITRSHLKSLLIDEFGPKLLREIGDSLFSLISQFTNTHWIRKAIKKFCSVLSLIKIIYSCTDQHSPDLTEITDKIKQGISHSKCTTDELHELEATVYFEKDLEKLVFDIIGVGNFDQIASNKVFHLTSILQEVYFYINSKNYVTEVEVLTNVVAQLAIRCENGGFEMQKDERFLEGTFVLFDLLTSKLKRIQLQTHMDFYRSLVGLTEQLFLIINSYFACDKEKIHKFINKLKFPIAQGMKKVLDYFEAEKYILDLDKRLQFLDMLLKMKIAVEEIKDYLDEEVVNATNRLLTENLKDYESVLHIICDADSKTTSAKMMKIYEDLANNIVESNLSGSDQHKVFMFMHKSSRFQKMLWVMATKQFGTAKTPIDQLKKLLDWPPSQGMIKLSVVSKEDIESQKKFSGVLDVFVNVQNKLIDGTITVEELTVVQQRFSKFFSISNTLCGIRKTEKVSTSHLKSRWEEYMYFTEWKSKVERLIRLCEQPRGLTVEMSNLKEDLTIDLSQMQLCRLCCRQKDKLKVTLTSLPDDLEAELSNLHVLAESRIFSLMWDASGRAVKNAISLEDVINAIYKPVISKLRELFKSLFEESITLSEISRVFKDYSTDLQIEELKKDIKLVVDKIFLPQTISQPNVNKLDVDLQPDDQESEESEESEESFPSDDDSDDWHFIGNDSNSIIDKAAEKITQVFKLQSCQKKADDLIRTGRRLKLKGDFSIFEDIQQKIAFNKDKKFELKSLTKAHFDAVDSLQMVTDEMGRCLADVLQCSPLITWLREKLDRLRDVKTFVDLMSISAGESDYEADRISNLHTVCLSYEPIIFDLPVLSGPDDLIKRCSTVLDGIKKDPTLPKKLLDCNRQLEWFKKERESYGSIAKSSMMETEAANRRGYYIVGAIQETDAKRSLENSLSLVVPEEDSNGKSKTGDEDKKTYSIDEIRDLQSKLMLIGGNKGRQRESGQLEKDAFLKMFAAVLRIATVYVDLCSAGCSLYLKWKRTFKCNLDDFERAIVSIEEEWHKMEATLHEWRNELHEKRWIHPNLNYYTIRQLMSLQKALHPVLSDHGNLRAVRDLPTQVFTLLEAIYPDISTTVIKDVVLKSEHVRRYESTQNNKDHWKNIESDEGKFSGIPVETVLTFIAELESEDIEENVAKAAAMQCGTNDLPEAIAWAFDNAKKNSVIEDLSNRMDKVLSFKENEEETGAVLERFDENDINEEPMSELPEYKFIDEAEFLSLDEIGVFLSELGNHKKLKKGKRKKCEVMSDGRPNVMVVPQDDLLLLLLEVYRETGNCLPKAEEVLICSENTTAEEIELLFRRALRDASNLYSLAFIDRLNYNVSEQAFKMLERLCGENAAKDNVSKTDNVSKKSGYNLLLLCASGKEEVSFLASALHSYRIASPPCPPKFDVKSFLEKQFNVASGHSPKDLHAARADCDGYSVRVVLSRTPGTGKSLYVKRAGEKLEELVEGSNSAIAQVCRSDSRDFIVTTPLHGTTAVQDEIIHVLLPYEKTKENAFPRIFHFDISSSVTLHLDSFLFNLIVLGSFSASDGSIWRKRSSDLYMIEITEVILSEEKKTGEEEKKRITNIGTIIPLLPMTICQTPKETFSALERNQRPSPGFDVEEFKSQAFQRVYQYLKMLGTDERAIDRFVFIAKEIRGDQADCLRILLQHCGVEDPSWREIQNFVHFFDKQLSDCENSVFCMYNIVGDTLPGFKTFVIKFMLQMAKDFATPSVDSGTEDRIGLISLRRRWEKSEHPYLFFNQGGNTMSFLGFTVNVYGDLMDKFNTKVIFKSVMTRELYAGLQRQGVELFSQYEQWDRTKQLEVLCQVMGIDVLFDPDETYELTMDNMMKILAIHMRFRCGIPVVIMGETGCGKTHLIRFMCKLKAGPGGPNNMLLVKVHGGVTKEDIMQRVEQAVLLAKENHQKRPDLETVLFFDEANTTDAVGLIKEVTCDQRIAGKKLDLASCGLQVIAACNPYRRHSDNMIFKLESAGLGYHVKAEDTLEKLGKIPLRHLVYRVHRLPESMLPLVWDFGQLSNETEIIYTAQIVSRYAKQNAFSSTPTFLDLVVVTLSSSQKFMREQKNECSFVSLRDVERAVQVMSWFYSKMDTFLPLINQTKERLCHETDSDEDEDVGGQSCDKNELSRMALILSLNVCYAARLEKRDRYYKRIAQLFDGNFALIDGWKQIQDEVYYCQQMFLDQLRLADDIAKNKALCENVFMMVVCIELRIPLFVVGKPGSSKSLAKMIIQDNMQGTSSYSDLFKTFKQILMCSYQCSPLSTAEGIIGTFRQCSRFQEGKDLDNFASVVVLDEVGLAEDSPRMPLKALHPLLEDGTDGSEELTLEGSELKAKRVSFVGISNWALDPAKMNRGLMLTRGQPDKNELINSAEGICNSDPITKDRIKMLFLHLSEAYLKIYEQQKLCERLRKSKKEEFFGLRDYYSLIKMIFTCAKSKKGLPTLQEIEFAVKRNFGGLEEINVWEVFQQALLPFFPQEQMNTNTEEDSLSNCSCSPVDLLRSSLQKNDLMKDGRYLLLLTENYAALRALEKIFPDVHANANVIFGSSFPKDQEFTQICRDINKIKICMETGMTVILLNMENLYESLYDALNQYYIWLGGQRYVDLGLGTHRVKCRVHDDFKLIVVAEKDTVYKSFPIPLINRLEKHFLVMSTMMNARQLNLADKLNTWALDFSSVTHRRKKYSIGDAFIGFNDDTAAAVILETFHVLDDSADDAQILNRSKERLLESATPEAVTRLTQTSLSSVAGEIWNTYFQKQHHLCLDDFLQHALKSAESSCGISAQVTTFSRLLSPHDQSQLAESLSGICTINCISLSQFQTEQQFCEEIRQYVKNDRMTNSVLIVQCDLGDERANLIACARHLCEEERNSHANETEMALHIIFIINLTRVAGGCKYLGSFHGVNWLSAHIDELRPPNHDLPSLINYANCEMSHLFKGNVVKQDEDKYESNGGNEENKSNAPDVECFSRESKMILDDDDDHSINDETIKQNGPDVFARQMLEPDEEMAISDSDENDMHHSLNALTPERDERMVIENPSVDKTNEQNTLDTNMEESPEPEVSFSLQLGLLRRCVQASVAEAINLSSEQDAERTTKRIHLLLDLLSPGKSFQEGTLERVFAETLLGLIHKVLKEKEQQAIEDRSKWFQDEAMTGNNIQECGTFRRALSYRIEKEVVPIFAHIISIIDMNCNLDLITENNWKTKLWLDLFICGDIVKVDSNQSKAKANKQSSSSMKCWFPFSNIVREKISSMINAHRKTDLQDDLENVIRQILKQTYYGQFLLTLPRGALKAYLRDVVFMEFEVKSVQHEIISTSVLAHIQYEKSDASMDIINFHLVICDPLFRKRVDCFLTLTASMPNVLGKIKDIVADARTALMDAIALRQCLYNLIPECDELLDEQSRFIWCQKLHEIKLGTCHLLELFETYQDGFPERSSEIFTDIRLLWTRLQIMGMFVEHVCPPGIPSSRQDVTAALMLFDTLEDINDEMTSAASWQRLEDFLKQVADLTNHDELESCNDCIVCLEDLEDPVQLPCMHVVCHSCMQKWQLESDTCPICQKKIPVEFKVSSDKTKRQMSFKLGEFRRRCISFFMEVVSNFCFSSKQKSTIDPGVVELMISYVTTEKRETKEMSPFQDYGVDPTPTVRSFLIQQLLKMKNSKQVKEYLQKYLDDNSQETQYGIQSRLELCLLLIHCIEDMEMAALSAKGQDVNILIPILTRKLEKIRSRNESSSVTDISSLDVLADIRATLNKLAEIVYGDIIENAWPAEDKEALKPKLSKVYSLFKDVCLRSSNENIQHYFLRQLLRLYGSNAMKEVIKYPVFEWLWPEESEKESSLEMDSFIIYGQQYKNMREKIAESALKEETQDLDSFWKDEDLPSSDVMNSAFVFLSIFREITNSSTKLSDEFCNSLKTFLMPKLVCPNLLKMLLEDGQSSEIELLNVTSSMNQREKGIAELVVHLLITLSLKNKDLLVQPLALLMLDPKSMANSYLPTMPDNLLSAVMEASQGRDPWITYQCPNGHAYVITECGNPVVVSKCHECGVNIGGTSYVSVTGNIRATRPADVTEKGHVLGEAMPREDNSPAERKLSRASLSAMRVLLHSTLLIAGCKNEDDTSDVITPPVNPKDVRQFLWSHIVRDINNLAKSIGSSTDDACILMHMILAEMLHNQNIRTNDHDFGTLSSKECRQEWEEKFDNEFIKPSLSSFTVKIGKVREAILNDKRLGANPIMRRLYEIEGSTRQVDSLDLPAHEYDLFWRYRTPVSVHRLNVSLREFVAKKGKAMCQMLQEFLEQEHVLRLVNRLPDTLMLQNILSQHLHHKINSDDKRPIKKIFAELFKDARKAEEMNGLVKAYLSLWKALQPMLLSNGKYSNSEYFNHKLTMMSPISYLLPSTTGPGMTALTAVGFLARSHNDMIETSRRIQGAQTEMKRVFLQDVTMAHLIAYDHDRDLIPMLYAHCDYSLELGKGTIVDYNFPALERQLVDTFIRGKPLIDIELQRIRYIDEVNSFSLLKELETKITQSPIPFDEELKMAAEFSTLSEVCDALRAAQIAVGLLAATGAKPDVLYKKYLEGILRMPLSQFLVSGKMQSACRLAHIRSIWLMLNVERAFRLYQNKEDPFNLEEKFREELVDESREMKMLRNIDVVHLIHELTEYIILELPEREDNALDYPLRECLKDYADRKSSCDVKGLEEMDDSVCLKHIYRLWLLVSEVYCKHKVR